MPLLNAAAYTCASCKSYFSGQPAMSNNCGTFCQKCNDRRIANSVEGSRLRYEALGNDCLWCGVNLDDSNRQGQKKMTRICDSCDSNRNWLLKCIRNSDMAASYVTKTEQRESPLRQERAALKAAAAAAAERETANSPAAADTPVSETRLDRLEKMLLRLTESLGGI